VESGLGDGGGDRESASAPLSPAILAAQSPEEARKTAERAYRFVEMLDRLAGRYDGSRTGEVLRAIASRLRLALAYDDPPPSLLDPKPFYEE
jgi:hypothetical protein